ncbi:unnamed protein product [Arctia plantaginis]|uniref:Pyruvate kinase n=1 Tax=Arctia plantaginis TaxID=874455 RepID=A0A8S1B7V9_ARCPL|nr:unnamed protein product [Arctia plantaginis]
MTWPTIFDAKVDGYSAMDLPGQQIAAAHANSPMAHLLNLDIDADPACQRLSGIMASMGPSTFDIGIMEKMMAVGMNLAYVNMSFGTREENREIIKMLREAAKSFSITMGKTYPLAIAMRLSGRKMRTGRIIESLGDSVTLEEGYAVKLTTDETYHDRCSNSTIYVDYMYLAEQLHTGDTILLDNETIVLKVEMISATTLTCKIERGGILGSYKDVFVPNVVFAMQNLPEKDILDIEMALQEQIDIIIPSNVTCAADITELRTVLSDKGKRVAIMANIQTIQGCHNFEEILKEADAILINRQELGSDITPKKLVRAQKKMIVQANKANIPICISAHLLNSMIYNKVPLRAEVLDIANCILDGADFLLLGPETAVGKFPVETITYLSNACKEAETCVWSKRVFTDLIDMMPLPCDQQTCTATAGVLAAQRCMAAAIVVITTTGNSAHIVAKFRPRCPIIAVTRYVQVARQMHMWRGIIPIIYEDDPDITWMRDVEKRANCGVRWAIEKGFARDDDPIVIISGWKNGSGTTNTMRVIYASLDPDPFA